MRDKWWFIVLISITVIVISIRFNTGGLYKGEILRGGRQRPVYANSSLPANRVNAFNIDKPGFQAYGDKLLTGNISDNKAVKSRVKKDRAQEERVMHEIIEANRLKNFEKAIAPAAKYLAQNPGVTTVRILLAETYLQKEDFSAAEAELKNVLSVSPNDAWALRALASCYLEQSRQQGPEYIKNKYLAEAKEAIDKALVFSSNDPHVYFVAADVLSDLKDESAALKYIDRAMALDPGNKSFAMLKNNLEGRRKERDRPYIRPVVNKYKAGEE